MKTMNSQSIESWSKGAIGVQGTYFMVLRKTLGLGLGQRDKAWLDNYDNESSDDDNDDDDVEKDEEDGKEEEHLAPVDPPTVPTDDPIPSRTRLQRAFESKGLLLYPSTLTMSSCITKFAATLPSSSPPPKNVESLKDNIRG
ncbi:hypothetical protein Tco_0642152 [Tanacetum coccineum]